jgi:hypothetical protein
MQVLKLTVPQHYFKCIAKLHRTMLPKREAKSREIPALRQTDAFEQYQLATRLTSTP